MSLAKIIVNMGTCGISSGSQKVLDSLMTLKDVEVKATSCMGLCALEPTAFICIDERVVGFSYLTDTQKDKESIQSICDGNDVDNNLVSRVIYDGSKQGLFSDLFKGQKRIVLRNAGWIDPMDIDDYISVGGYSFLSRCKSTEINKEQVLDVLEKSGLRGRGGAGFPTAKKWRMLMEKISDEKYVICNGDEGDPGAFMDRSVLEGDPHSVIEGLQIAAYATGATKCFMYVRAEYPLALKTLNKAIKDAKDKDVLCVPVEIREGAGAFVCGEETALIASIEGKRGMPRFRPPYPVESGLWGKPTIINNVETLAAVPWIMNNPSEYEKIGYADSKGTKVFALAGKIKRGGLVEIPFGMSLRELIFDVGKGIQNDKDFKAVQIGGPSGGCLPASLLDLRIDYEELKQSGAIVGSGGLVVMDESSCMVDIARFFLSFTTKESCGKCTFCRIGTKRMLETLEDIVNGKSNHEHLERLYELSDAVSKLSLCGLGQTAPNPVITTLRYFIDEYHSHIKDKKCTAGVCSALIKYSIDEQKCVACMLCKKECPVSAIVETKRADGKKVCRIDNSKCISCGRCYKVCKFSSVLKG
jgi:NADH-quinone oxidoreductase subunit F